VDKQALADQVRAYVDDCLKKAKAGILEPSDLEDWSNPCCGEFGGVSGPSCVLCPLDGSACENLQKAYNQLYDGQGGGVEPLQAVKAILEGSLCAWLNSEHPADLASESAQPVTPFAGAGSGGAA